MLQLQPKMEEYKNKGVEFITITLDNEDTVRSFWSDNELTGDVFLDTQGSIISNYGVMSVPHGLFIDQEGNVTYERTGWSGTPLEDWQQEADELISE